MASAREADDSEERNEDLDQSDVSGSLRERGSFSPTRQPFDSNTSRLHVIVRPLFPDSLQQVLTRSFPLACLVYEMCACVYVFMCSWQSENQWQQVPISFPSGGLSPQSTPSPNTQIPNLHQPAGHESEDSDEDEDEIQSYANLMAMQIFATLVGSVRQVRRRCVLPRMYQ